MTDCFISYKREDQGRVSIIVHALRAAGREVWWDADIPGGGNWRGTIAAKLQAARCVLVCWTETSVSPAGSLVHEEADSARRRRVLLPLLLDAVTPPFGFGEVQALNLVGWNGDPQAPAWQAVLQHVDAILTGKPASDVKRKRRRWAWIGAVASIATAAIALAADVTGLHGALCTPQRLGSACAWVGLGPDAADVKAWEQALAAPDRGGALRAYLAAHPTGAYAPEAQARLQACQTIRTQDWAPLVQTTVLVVGKDRLAAGFPNEPAAREAMGPAVLLGARSACAAYHSEVYRAAPGANIEQPADAGWRCAAEPGGWRCGFDGPVSCALEKLQTTEREVCPR